MLKDFIAFTILITTTSIRVFLWGDREFEGAPHSNQISHINHQAIMDSEGPYAAATPLVFDGDIYQVWAVKMEAFLDASDLWNLFIGTMKFLSFQTTYVLHKLGITRIKGNINPREKLAYLKLSPQQCLSEL